MLPPQRSTAICHNLITIERGILGYGHDGLGTDETVASAGGIVSLGGEHVDHMGCRDLAHNESQNIGLHSEDLF